MSANTSSRRSTTLSATVVAILASAAASVLVPQSAAAESAQAAQLRGMNGDVLKIQSEAHHASVRAAAETKARQALGDRAAVMRALMASDPTAAEKLAFPASVLESLAASFPEAAASLEQRGRWSGELEYLVEDGADLKSHRDVFRLHRGTEVLDVKFSGREPPGLKSGQKLTVGGIRSGKSVVASEVQLQDAFQDAGATVDGTTASCGPSGPQAVLSVLVDLPAYNLPSVTTQDFVRGVLLGNAYAGAAQSTTDWSVDDFWQQASDGKASVDTTNSAVVGPVSLSSNYNTDSTGASYCDYYGVRDEVIKALDSSVDFRRYSHIQIVLPKNGACTWAGVANVGCRTMSSNDGTFNASVAWQRADTMQTRTRGVELSTHEMGHNLGMSHASSRDFGGSTLGALSDAGTINEYGDMHSTMGSWNLGFYASSHAANQLGWLSSGSGYQTVESSGTYTVSNYEARGGATRALKIRRGTGNDAWLWVESRQNTGIYSSQLNASLFGGALIHYQDSTTGGRSHLLDFTTGTTSFGDAALPAGTTWTDQNSNLSVTVTSITAGAMTVAVNYSGVVCTPAAPTITASPTGVATEYGSSAQFNVTVKNNSSSGCGSETFSLDSAVPTGWSKAFGTSALTLSPGQQSATTLTVGVPNPYALGTYAVTSNAKSSTGKSASDSDNVTVVEPANTLTVNVSGGSVALSTPVKTCTSTCSTNYSGSTTSVTLTAKPATRMVFTGWSGACSGTATSCTVTMNADKTVTANFKKQTGKK